MGCVYAYVIAITFLGPEYLGRRTDVAGDHDFEEVAGHRSAVAGHRSAVGTTEHDEHTKSYEL
jgi:SHS family lactate transporter-like MFS transporter